MNKSQITLAAVGGVAVVGALALGYFIWDASDVRSENAASLDSAVSSAEGIVRKLPMKPGSAEFKLYAENAAAYDAWRTNAEHFVSRGDYLYEKTTPPALKQAFQAEARRLASRGGCIEGAFVKPDFGFGFPDYVTGGALPPEKDLKRLQREWNDVTTVLKMLANCGSNEVGVVDVRLGAVAAAESVEEAPTTKKGKKAKKQKQKKAKAEEAKGPKTEVTRFTVDLMTRPSVLVKALNAFATDARFIVVENCTFTRERDEIADKLGGDAKRTQGEPTATRRARKRGGAQAAKAEANEGDSGVVTDPASAPYLKVTMAFSVYDFGTLDADEARGAEVVNQEQ